MKKFKILFMLVILALTGPTTLAMENKINFPPEKTEKKTIEKKKINDAYQNYEKNLDTAIDEAVLNIPDLTNFLLDMKKDNKDKFKEIFLTLIKNITFKADLNTFQKTEDEKATENNLKIDETSNLKSNFKKLIKLKYAKKKHLNNWEKIEEFHRRVAEIKDQLDDFDTVDRICCLLKINFSPYKIKDLQTDMPLLDMCSSNKECYYKIIYKMQKILSLRPYCKELIKKLIAALNFLKYNKKTSKKNIDSAHETLYFLIKEDYITKELLVLLQFLTKIEVAYEKIRNNLIYYLGDEIAKKNNITIEELTKNFENHKTLFQENSKTFFNKNPKIFEQNFQKVYQDCMSKNLNLYSCLINLNFQAKSNCW